MHNNEYMVPQSLDSRKEIQIGDELLVKVKFTSQEADTFSLEHELWGKTATIIDGTNQPLSYGLFIGGMDNTGIIVLLRKGNAHLAAKWAQVLLSNNGM